MKLKRFGLLLGAIVFTFLLITITWLMSEHYLNNQKLTTRASIHTCKNIGIKHIVVVQNDQAIPEHTASKLCDSLTITNLDNAVRLMAFGPHEDHQSYDGITEKLLDKNQSLTVVLNQTGNFEFHDHIGDIVKGSFTVTN